MKLAIIQPNFFPHRSYYDLIKRVDKVIFLDDVYYNNKSWVNKTLLKIKSKNFYFRVPIENQERANIKDLKIKNHKWKKNFLKMINLEYKHCPNFKSVFPIVEEIANFPTDNISHLAAYSIFRISTLFEDSTKFSFSSFDHPKVKGSMDNKILTICKKEKASTYYSLYKLPHNSQNFLKNNIKTSNFTSYNGKLSIIEDLMTNHSYKHFLKKECNPK
tara:strand:+ start:118 stop:768 length:651 start_codon:yes stop_codon:yes gene_type:complete